MNIVNESWSVAEIWLFFCDRQASHLVSEGQNYSSGSKQNLSQKVTKSFEHVSLTQIKQQLLVFLKFPLVSTITMRSRGTITLKRLLLCQILRPI